MCVSETDKRFASKNQGQLDQVAFLLRRGLTESQIAEHIGVSLRTVVRYVAQIKKQNSDWFEGNAKLELIHTQKSTFDSLTLNLQRLEDLYDKETDSIKKLHIISSMNNLLKLRLDIAGEFPTLKKYKCSNK